MFVSEMLYNIYNYENNSQNDFRSSTVIFVGIQYLEKYIK